MALVLENSLGCYKYLFFETRDSRSENFFLLKNPVSITLLIVGYVLMSKYGPKIMESRQAFELKAILMIYNLLQVILNLALGVYGTYHVYIAREFNYNCQPVNYSSTEEGMLELKLFYCYFLLKLLDLFDTVFIILRKKNSQLSFLHCYHHSIMALGTYCAVLFIPGGHITFLGLINTFVHSFMYFYFFLTTFKPELKKSIWWKKHITQVQMAQFMILIFHFLRGALSRDCDFPKSWMWFMTIQNVFMLTLFGDFYRKAYLIKKKL